MLDQNISATSPVNANGLNASGGQVIELRGDKRASLLIRSAKLICQSGEYPSVVRDVSTGGCKLRHFQAIPPETYVLLELANGETYAMLRVWSRGLESGYRFLSAIDVDSFIEESGEFPRRPIRLRVQRHATVHANGVAVSGALRNLSQGGAGLMLASELALRQPVRLSVPGMADCHARIAWRRGLDHGLVFERAMTMDELARVALDLQPFLPISALAQPQLFEARPSRRATA